MKSLFMTKLLSILSGLAMFAAISNVNSACNIVIYEPKMPEEAARLIK